MFEEYLPDLFGVNLTWDQRRNAQFTRMEEQVLYPGKITTKPHANIIIIYGLNFAAEYYSKHWTIDTCISGNVQLLCHCIFKITVRLIGW